MSDDKKIKKDHLTLQLLDAIDRQGEVSQRHLAKQMGVALGLANSYLKRCIRTGYVKISQVPANRYLYYLTPTGFAEKSRLTSRYLSYSFSFYREASDSCARVFDKCRSNGWNEIVLCGVSDLAEIASLRAIEMEIDVIGVFDTGTKCERVVKKPVYRTLAEVPACHAFVVTELVSPADTYRVLVSQYDDGRVLVPSILRFDAGPDQGGNV